MTFDKFLKRNQLIAQHLEQIAQCGDEIGWVDSATPADSSFRDLLAAQERLLTAAEQLLESRAADVRSKTESSDEATCASAGASAAMNMLPLRIESGRGPLTTH